MAASKICVVCGTFSRTSACDRCGTSFCERHLDHDCLTPQSGDRHLGRETGLGLLRSELERGLAGAEQPAKTKSKVVIRMDAPGEWDRNDDSVQPRGGGRGGLEEPALGRSKLHVGCQGGCIACTDGG